MCKSRTKNQLFSTWIFRDQQCRKSHPKKREKDDADGPAKDEPDGEDVKTETKDEDSGGESDMDNKANNTVPGEESDVRDVIYNLESFGIKITCYPLHLCNIFLCCIFCCNTGIVSNTCGGTCFGHFDPQALSAKLLLIGHTTCHHTQEGPANGRPAVEDSRNDMGVGPGVSVFLI